MIDTLMGRIEICIHVLSTCSVKLFPIHLFFDCQSGSWGGNTLRSCRFSFHVCRRGNDDDSIEILISTAAVYETD